MEELLLKYGYALLFVGVLIEGETFLLAGSFLAQRGYFNIGMVAAVALAANTLGSQFYYMAARVRGRHWFESRFAGNERYERAIQWIGKHGNLLVVLSRFAFGFRIIIPAACGAFGMPVAAFGILNLIAGLLWVIPTALLGFYLGSSIESALRQAYQFAGALMLVPLLILVGLLAFRHLHRVFSIFQKLQWSDLHAVVPFVMGFMGILNISTAIWPNTDAHFEGIERWLPLEATQQESRIVMLFAGIALLQVTRNLALRKELAWWVALITLSISFGLHLLPYVDMQHSIVAGLLLSYLLYFRRRFYTRSDPASMRKGLAVMPLLALLVFMYGLVGLYATRNQFVWPPGSSPAKEAFRAGIMILSPDIVAATPYASRFLTSLQIAGWIARVYILVLLLRPVILREWLREPKEDVDRIFKLHGNHSLAALAVETDKHHVLLQNGQAMVAYAAKGSIALSCGDPMAPDDLFPAAVKEYADYCRKHGWKPCVYLACEERLPIYQSLGFDFNKSAEEAIIDLLAPEHVAILSNVRARRYDRVESLDPLIDEQLEEITEDWLQAHHVGEMGFTIGHFSLQSLRDGPVFILGNRHKVDAFCTWLPYKNGSAMMLALARRRHTAPAQTLEALLSFALRSLQQDGIREASIADTILGREQLEQFNPLWQNRYVVYPKGANFSRIMRTIAAIKKR